MPIGPEHREKLGCVDLYPRIEERLLDGRRDRFLVHEIHRHVPGDFSSGPDDHSGYAGNFEPTDFIIQGASVEQETGRSASRAA